MNIQDKKAIKELLRNDPDVGAELFLQVYDILFKEPKQRRRPALKIHGSKWMLADWIRSYFPKHDTLIIPCLGSGSVLLKGDAVKLEVVNDINGRLTNFFTVLRDDKRELLRRIKYSCWSEDEYKLAHKISDDLIEDARRVFLLSWMSVSGFHLPTTYRMQKKASARGTMPSVDLINHDLDHTAKRIQNVHIKNEDGVDFIKRFVKGDEALIYFDPPYVEQTRSVKNLMYSGNEVGIKFHVDAAEQLNKHQGYVVISGYESALYDELYAGWHKAYKTARTSYNGKRVEALYISPKTEQALIEERVDGNGIIW